MKTKLAWLAFLATATLSVTFNFVIAPLIHTWAQFTVFALIDIWQLLALCALRPPTSRPPRPSLRLPITLAMVLIAATWSARAESVHPEQQQTQCSAGAAIALVIIAVGVVIVYQLNKCVHKLLNPDKQPDQPPGKTNAPAFHQGPAPAPGASPMALPPSGNALGLTNFVTFYNWWDYQLSEDGTTILYDDQGPLLNPHANPGYTDELGNPYDVWYSGPLPVWSSSNLVTWQTNYTVTGYLNLGDGLGVEVYREKGMPVCTNWINLNGHTNTVTLNALRQDGSPVKFVKYISGPNNIPVTQ